MAKVRGGKAVPVIPFSAPKGTNTTANPWNLNVPGLNTNNGHGAKVPVPATAPAGGGGGGAAASNMSNIDWSAVLALDPGYTRAKAAHDANIANLNERFDGATNPFSTIKQLRLNLGQNLRSNANAHVATNSLFSGGTAQGAINANRDNQKARYDATNSLTDAIGAQNEALGGALTDAEGRVLNNPALYGLNTTGPDAAAAAAGGGAAGAGSGAPGTNAPKPPANPYVDNKSVTQVLKTIKKNPATAWKT